MPSTCDACSLQRDPTELGLRRRMALGIREAATPPKVAVADASLRGIGSWAHLCEDHLALGTSGTFFEARPCPDCGKLTKRLVNGRPFHGCGK